tara:strand:- start:226 stop:498 length:273 start_codon:yes stop_codon:yes gene_type:complete
MHLWRSGGALLYFDAVWIGHHTDLYGPLKPKTGKTMIIKKFRTIKDSKVIRMEAYVYAFSVTYILHYADGRKERIRYPDTSIDKDIQSSE